MRYKKLRVSATLVAGKEQALEAVNIPMEGRRVSADKQKLLSKLIKAGDDHAKVTRGIFAWIDMHMQAGFMIEFDTYRIGIDTLSTSSSMHDELRYLRGEELADAKQKLLPDKYYHRSLVVTYQTLRRIYFHRRTHRHPDWVIFCKFIEGLPDFTTLIYPEGNANE